MADVNRIFTYLEEPKTRIHFLRICKTLMVSPHGMRNQLIQLINKEIKTARSKKPAAIFLKLNSLSDGILIDKLYEAAKAGVRARGKV